MKILVVHNRYRSTAPSGDSRCDPRHGIEHLLEISRFAVTRPPTGGS